MIYSASRRTDMPAFYPEAIVERVRRSRKLEAIVLWTKDVRNLVDHAGLAAVTTRIPTIVQFTATGLAGTVWEPHVPETAAQAEALAELAKRLPRGAVRWRFDPIVPIGDDVIKRFIRSKAILDDALNGVDDVTTSFIDNYGHAVRRVTAAGLAWPAMTKSDKRRVLADMVTCFPDSVTRPVRLCCEPELLDLPGVAMARCVDGDLFARLYGLPLAELDKDPGQRTACGCVKSTEIGSYDLPCRHSCLYCYASRTASPLNQS